MNIHSRRAFLKAAGASVTMIALPPAGAQSRTPRTYELTPGTFNQRLRPTGPATPVWGFNGSVPGPLLRFKQGEDVRIRVVNKLPESTTVHWHGLRVPNAMDGVPQVTQVPIAVGGTFDYAFNLPDSGTHWYHPHQASFEQVSRGLYGLFIVDEARPLEVDREVAWVLSDFKLDKANKQVEDFGHIRDIGGSGRIGNLLTVNGRQAGAPMEVRQNERIRLRLLNAASARVFLLAFDGHQPWVLAHDGNGVEPHPIPGGVLVIGPGMRTDLVLDCTGDPGQSFTVIDRRENNAVIARLNYSRQPAVRARPLGVPQAIAANPIPEPDLSKAVNHFVVFEGGLLGKPAIGVVDGKPQPMAEIMRQQGLAWSMNYTAQHEHALNHKPLLTVPRGEHVLLKMINETEFEHPMHLHGHTFRVMSINDRPTRHREWRDTVMIGPRGSAEVAFVADNPGEWMFHCHILEHAAGGMMGTIAVEDA